LQIFVIYLSQNTFLGNLDIVKIKTKETYFVN